MRKVFLSLAFTVHLSAMASTPNNIIISGPDLYTRAEVIEQGWVNSPLQHLPDIVLVAKKNIALASLLNQKPYQLADRGISCALIVDEAHRTSAPSIARGGFVGVVNVSRHLQDVRALVPPLLLKNDSGDVVVEKNGVALKFDYDAIAEFPAARVVIRLSNGQIEFSFSCRDLRAKKGLADAMSYADYELAESQGNFPPNILKISDQELQNFDHVNDYVYPRGDLRVGDFLNAIHADFYVGFLLEGANPEGGVARFVYPANTAATTAAAQKTKKPGLKLPPMPWGKKKKQK